MVEPWTRFRNLCRYYADCVKYSEQSQEYLFPNQLGISFMMPRLPYNWHLADDEFVVATSPDDVFVRSNLLKASDEEELFLGYPLNSFISPDGFECICPIMMFPVSIAVQGQGFTTGMRMKVDRQGISINQDWIEYHIPKSDKTAFQRACEQANDELGCVDVELVLNYISRHFGIKGFSPNTLDFSVRHSQSKKGLLNTAVLFVGNKTTYTKNLLAELRRISDEPDSVLDKTALAYVFREPPLPNNMIHGGDIDEKRIPVSFTKRRMNAGQFAAVEKALNCPVVKVVGPPGTGKSFMAVNLIANEVLNGGSVLFTSKNHKAIHAIYDKTPDAIEDSDFPLVSFCTTPDNPTNADWQKSQQAVDERVDKAQLRLSGQSRFPDVKMESPWLSRLDVALSQYRDAESHVDRYQHLRDTISSFERLLSEINEHITNIRVGRMSDAEAIRLLEKVNVALHDRRKGGFFNRLIEMLGRIFGRGPLCNDIIREQLSEIAPSLANAFLSHKTLCKETQRLLDVFRCKTMIGRLEESEIFALKQEESALSYSNLKASVKASLHDAESVVQRAYVEQILKSVLSIDDTSSIVAKCKDEAAAIVRANSLPFLSAIDKGDKYDAALASFQTYLKIFPAWAATMLSLKRAAPCLPGVFSLAVIDEASQCDIPPMIPVLYRSQRIAIVGDPSQFPPVITLKRNRDLAFRRKWRVDGHEYRRFAYGENSAFGVCPQKAVLLNEHFRCADGIAEYFNDEFYDGDLSLCCETGRTGQSAVGGIKPGMVWMDANGGDDAETEAAISYLKELKRNGFQGTIGVISPLRNLANRLKTAAADCKSLLPNQLDISSQINTANGFQGGECDVILFLLGMNGDRKHGEEWYITSAENKYIYNVSVSRAKHLFVSFGDRRRVATCGLPYIQRLIPEERSPRKVSIGPGEERLRQALERASIKTETQYPVSGRYLDLAIPELKIDIEVDGQAWHMDRNGCRKADDIHRDILLETLGWHVVRFWHYQVVKDIRSCVDRVRQEITRHTS